MNINIRIITLNTKSNNSLELISAIKHQGLDASFFIGADGRKSLPNLNASEIVNQNQCLKYRLSHLSNSEIGCYLSHYRCILEEYNKGTDKLCILEDDVIIEDDFSSCVSLIFNLENKYELIKLTALKIQKRKPSVKLNESYIITRPSKGTLGTQGYIINRAGMKKVIRKGMPIQKPIDKFYDHFWESLIHTYSIEPYIIWEKKSASSILKPKKNLDASYKDIFKFKIYKIQRSINRFFYKIKYIRSYYPNSKIADFHWKTTRKIKKKYK